MTEQPTSRSWTARIRNEYLPLASLLTINFAIYRAYWFGAKTFTGRDFFLAYAPLLNYQTDCIKELSWPLWNPFMNFGAAWVDHYINSSLFPTHLLMGLLTGSSFDILQREVLGWLFLGGAGVYLAAREMGRSRRAAVIAGASYMLCGQLLALPSWSQLVYNAATYPFLVLGYHRSVRMSRRLSLVTIVFLTLSLLGGYLVSSILGLYLFMLYVLLDSKGRGKLVFGAQYAAISIAVALLLASPKLVPIFNALGTGPRLAQGGLSIDPINVVNFGSFPSLLVPVKYYFSLYLGMVCVVAVIYALMTHTLRVNSLAWVCIISAWLLMVDDRGNISLLRSATLFLPGMRMVSNEWLQWFYPSFFAILFASGHVDSLLEETRKRIKAASFGAYGVLAITVFLALYDIRIHSAALLIQLCLAVLWFLVLTLVKRVDVQGVLIALLLMVEFGSVLGRVDVNQPPVREGDRVAVRLTHQWMASRSFEDGQLVDRPKNIYVLDDTNRPPVSASRNWPVLRSGIYAQDNENYLVDLMNQKQFAGWWYNRQASTAFVELFESPMLAELEGQPLAVRWDPVTRSESGTATLDRITCSSFALSSRSGTGGLLLLYQMFDPRWKARVNGKDVKIIPVDRYFMGVELGPGEALVEFEFVDRSFLASLAVAAVTLCTLLSFLIAKRRKTKMVTSGTPADAVS